MKTSVKYFHQTVGARSGTSSQKQPNLPYLWRH